MTTQVPLPFELQILLRDSNQLQQFIMTEENQQIQQILQEIASKAGDVAKVVLATYSPEKDHEVNKEAMIKNTVEYLETCALFLKIKLLNEANKKLYPNKSALADRIILVIESFFPTTCQDCSSRYTISFNDPEPALRCLFCLQGSHNCQQRLDAMQSLQRLPPSALLGLAWLCHSCHKKNNALHSPQISATRPDDLPIQPESSSKDCDNYRHGKCRHGASGQKLINDSPCKFLHRKKCLKWCNHGNNAQFGCTQGDNCDDFHPILCKFSLHRDYCKNLKCTYAHPKGGRLKDHPPSQQSQHQINFNSPNERKLLPNLNAPYSTNDYSQGHNSQKNFSNNNYSYNQSNRYRSNKRYRNPNNPQNYIPHESEYPVQNDANVTQKSEVAPFLVDLIQSMEEKFSNQIAALQTTLCRMQQSPLPPQGFFSQVPPTPTAPSMHFQGQQNLPQQNFQAS